MIDSQTFVVSNGDMNLIQSALGLAASQARNGQDPGMEPGDYLEAADRLATQYKGGPAKAAAERRLGRLDHGVTRREVYPVAYAPRSSWGAVR